MTPGRTGEGERDVLGDGESVGVERPGLAAGGCHDVVSAVDAHGAAGLALRLREHLDGDLRRPARLDRGMPGRDPGREAARDLPRRNDRVGSGSVRRRPVGRLRADVEHQRPRPDELVAREVAALHGAEAARCGDRLRVAVLVGEAGRADVQRIRAEPVLVEGDVDALERGRRQAPHVRARHDRVGADRREHVPGRHRAEVVVARDAGGPVGEQRQRGADDVGRLPRLAGPLVQVRRVQIRLVVRVVGVLAVVRVRAVDPHVPRGALGVLLELREGEELVEALLGRVRAAEHVDEARHVLRHEPLVLHRGALVESGRLGRVGVSDEESGAVAGAEALRRPVEDRAVVLSPDRVPLRVGVVPETGRHRREQGVGQRVLERRGSAVVQVVVARPTVLRRLVRHVAVLEVHVVARPPVRDGCLVRLIVGVVREHGVRALLVPFEQPLVPGADEEGSAGVSRHDVRLDGAVSPPGQPPELLARCDDRDRHVPGLLGREQVQQLLLGPVGVPQREVLVVREAVRAVDVAVPAAVAPVDVRPRVRCEEAAVQRRVEDPRLLLVGRRDLHRGQPLLPRGRRRIVRVVERGNLRVVVRPGALRVHVAEGCDGLDVAIRGRVERDVRPRALAVRAARVRGDLVPVPGSRRGDVAVEGREGVDREGLRVLAEAARRDRRLDRAVVHDAHGRVRDRVQRLARVDQDRRLRRLREGVPLHRGVLGRGQFGIDRAGRRLQTDAVVPRSRVLVVVGVAEGVVLVARLVGDPRGRQHRHQAAQAASDAGEVHEGEPADARIAVVVADVVPVVRRELHHAERHARAGVRVPVVLRADEGVHVAGEVFGRGGRRRGRRREGGGRDHERRRHGDRRAQRSAEAVRWALFCRLGVHGAPRTRRRDGRLFTPHGKHRRVLTALSRPRLDSAKRSGSGSVCLTYKGPRNGGGSLAG